jgi:hypothetical protein
MRGDRDLAKLFRRVTALEERETDEDMTISRITKQYESLGVSVTVVFKTHQYRLCGDTNPLYGSTLSANHYL